MIKKIVVILWRVLKEVNEIILILQELIFMVSQKHRLPFDLSTLSIRWRERQSAGDPLYQLTLSMQRLLYQSADRPFVVTPSSHSHRIAMHFDWLSDAPSIEFQIGTKSPAHGILRASVPWLPLPCRSVVSKVCIWLFCCSVTTTVTAVRSHCNPII